MAIPHPRFNELAARCVRLERDGAVGIADVGFRFAALKYGKSKDLISGEGARISGGRLNGIGTFPVIYTSTDPQTATAESFQNFTDFGFDKKRVRPKVVAGVEIKLAAVLDLTDRQIRRRLVVNLADLAEPWWLMQEAGNEALTQAIGRAAYDAGFEAVRLPSARRKGGTNLDVFPDKLRDGSLVKVLGEEELHHYTK